VPARLAPDTEVPGPSRDHIIWDDTGTTSPSGVRRKNKSNLHVVNSDEPVPEPEITPGIGITVQPPVSLSYNHFVPL
jgi:hypothetical protein